MGIQTPLLWLSENCGMIPAVSRLGVTGISQPGGTCLEERAPQKKKSDAPQAPNTGTLLLTVGRCTYSKGSSGVVTAVRFWGTLTFSEATEGARV